MTTGSANNIARVGMDMLKMVAYPNNPAPATNPILGIGKLWLKVLL